MFPVFLVSVIVLRGVILFKRGTILDKEVSVCSLRGKHGSQHGQLWVLQLWVLQISYLVHLDQHGSGSRWCLFVLALYHPNVFAPLSCDAEI